MPFWWFARLIVTSVPFILLHSPGGDEIVLNVEEISSIRPSKGEDTQQKDVRCVIVMTNGRNFGITETCREIGTLIEEAQQKAIHRIEEPNDRAKPTGD